LVTGFWLAAGGFGRAVGRLGGHGAWRPQAGREDDGSQTPGGWDARVLRLVPAVVGEPAVAVPVVVLSAVVRAPAVVRLSAVGAVDVVGVAGVLGVPGDGLLGERVGVGRIILLRRRGGRGGRLRVGHGQRGMDALRGISCPRGLFGVRSFFRGGLV
jgi:hypothetical protein